MKIFFNQSLNHFKMSASLVPDYKRYVQVFQVRRKLVKLSLGMIYRKNNR